MSKAKEGPISATCGEKKYNVEPIGDRIIVKRLEVKEEIRPGGLIIPDTAKEKPREAEVVAVGPGRYVDGLFVKPTLNVGDRVLFAKYSGNEIKLNGDELLIMREDDILVRIV
jgi:chaperonin GroES